MNFVNASEMQEITAAIKNVESQTVGEIVTVIADACDDYMYIPTMWSAIAAILLIPLINLSNLSYFIEYPSTTQVVLFFSLLCVSRIPAVKMLLVPKKVKYARTHRVAMEQFLQHKIHNTPARAGVLIFVSVAEQYVEILAEEGINEKVDEQLWQQYVDAFIVDVKAKQIKKGFVETIENVGNLLISHFPRNSDNEAAPDTLPNHLIVIE